MPEHFLDSFPCGVVEAPILPHAGRVSRQVVHRRHGQRQRHGIALGERPAAKMHEFGGAFRLIVHVRLFSAVSARLRPGWRERNAPLRVNPNASLVLMDHKCRQGAKSVPETHL